MGFRKRNPIIDLPNKIHHPMVALQGFLSAVETPVVLDVGAYEGQSAVYYRRFFPEARIYSFEPHPEIFNRMVEVTKDDPHVHPFQLAISDSDGRAEFHTSDFPAANSLLPLHDKISHWAPPSLMSKWQSMEVETMRIDTFCAKEGIDHIDCLKSDAQGHDVAVLRGAEGLLRDGRISCVIAEVNVAPHYERQDSMGAMVQLMEGHGYRLFDFFGTCHNTKGQLMWCDLLFVSPDLMKTLHGPF